MEWVEVGLPVRVLRASGKRSTPGRGRVLEGSTQRPFSASSARLAALPLSRPAPALHRRLPHPASGRRGEFIDNHKWLSTEPIVAHKRQRSNLWLHTESGKKKQKVDMAQIKKPALGGLFGVV